LKYEAILIVDRVLEENTEDLLQSMFKNKPNLTSLRLLFTRSGMRCSVTLGKNIGVALAKGVILLFADDDALVYDDIAPLVNRLQKGECAGIQPLILRLANKDIIDSAGDYIQRYGGIYGAYCKGAGVNIDRLSSDLHLEEIPSLRGAFMLVKRDAFLAIGGMDESLDFNFEDVDLGWRLNCAGYTLLFDPSVKALHKGSSTTGEFNSISEKVHRLGLINLFAINLKIHKPSLWLYTIGQFEKRLLINEFFRPDKEKYRLFKLFSNVYYTNKAFLIRVLNVSKYRRILAKTHFKGRQKLDDMSRGKRFIRA
jgi:GT2 family glycosyltransferase